MVFIGSAGWTIPRQFNFEFPEVGSHLERYARVLGFAEINSSFYRPHRKTTWERWADTVPPAFRFSVKAPKFITHESSLECTATDLAGFIDQACLLGEKLGPILFQTPPKLQFDHHVANRFFSLLRTVYRGQAAIEPRHPSWFTDEAESLLIDFDIARVAADPAPTPKGKFPGGSTSFAYYRLHGVPRIYHSKYSPEAMVTLANSLQRSRSSGDVWCVFDNTASGAAAGDALHLKRLLADGF